MRSDQQLSQEELTQVIQSLDSTSVLVKSQIAGLGKTTLIKNSLSKQQIIDFPLSGEIEFLEIGERLQKIQQNPYNLLVIIDFNRKNELVNDIIFSLCLLRKLYYQQNVFTLPKDTVIFIELANETYQAKVNYLNYMKPVYMNTFDINNLIVDTKISTVCSYLQCLQQNTLDSVQPASNNMLQKEVCIKLLNQYFLAKQIQKGQQSTYIQLNVYISILYELIKNMENSLFNIQLKSILQSSQPNINFSKIRTQVFQSFLETVEEFTTKSIQNVRKSQNQSLKLQENQNNKEDIDKEVLNEESIKVRWENSNHFLYLITESGSPIPLYKDSQKIPAEIKQLILSQQVGNNQSKLDEYSQFSNEQFIKKLQLFCKQVNNQFLQQCTEANYVLTVDNFLKMALIYMRVMAKIPVIIMGETGCGKTSLIKFFVEKVKQDHFMAFNIHAGITRQMICQEIEKFKQKATELIPSKQNLWVFFDEFNTTENVPLICEILCYRTFRGEKLPENMIFLAACNPYKVKSKQISFEENVGIRRDRFKQQNLLYTVYHIPDAAIEYIWDFGFLQRNVQLDYISQILKKDIKNRQLEQYLTRLIDAAHEYFRDKEDCSSVSLRDVSRFIILYTWFKDQLKLKYELQNSQDQRSYCTYINFFKKLQRQIYYNGSEDQWKLEAGLLSFCHCYYLRLAHLDQRKQFLQVTIDQIKHTNQKINSQYVIELMEREQYDLLARMEIPKETALNQALRENIFAIIPCVVNRIPIFICGKPGCSKTLTINLVFQHLRGLKSINPYFKCLPELQIVPFQGSESCTSENILKVYERAQKYTKAKNNQGQKLLPVFVFDEIGLAEISKHNPLKVLHSILEVENRDIAFIGVSNWRLDASKMNRALYLARPDPDKEDLILTAQTLYKSCADSKATKKYEDIIEALAKSYFDMKQDIKQRFAEYIDYYGLRDFYSLIKMVSRRFIQQDQQKPNALEYFNKEEELLKIVKNSIERNFSGNSKFNGVQIFESYLLKNFDCSHAYPHIENTPTLQLIEENLQDKNARYLMLISKSDIASYILDKRLKSSIKDRRFLIGSNFEDDKNQEHYGFRSLSDCILYMEKGISVIFRNMEHIYSSLYDLFNQNFAIQVGKRYCRVALGALYNPKCIVHDNFHSIIFMEDSEDILKIADPPFLNRFEKHYLSIEQILTQEEKDIKQEGIRFIQQLTQFPHKSNCKLAISLNAVFPIYSEENLALLIFQNLEQKNKEQSLQDLKRELIKNSSIDILLLLQFANIDQNEKD